MKDGRLSACHVPSSRSRRLVLESAASRKAKNLDEFLKSNPTISEKLSDIMGKVGEKVEVSRVTTENTNNGLVVDYIHPGSIYCHIT